MIESEQVTIIGSGPAGLTAAVYTARAGLSPILIEGLDAGGQLMLTTAVENFPGFRDGIMGPDLMAEMRAQAERFGSRIVQGHVSSVDVSRRPFTIHTSEASFRTSALIIATGASARLLGLPAERALIGRGVSTCATCDGYFFRGRRIAIVGGGDSALEEALFLSKLASHVTVIHRRDALRGSQIMRERALGNPKISFLWNTVVEDIDDVEKGVVTGLRLRHIHTGERSRLDGEGLFVAIGHTPNTALFSGQLETDANGYIVTTNGTSTSVQGVFACGDVQDDLYRQAITAAGSGCMAAIDAERFLARIVPAGVYAAA